MAASTSPLVTRSQAQACCSSSVNRWASARRMLVAHLLKEHGEAEDEDYEDDDEPGADGADDEHRIMRLLIGSRVLRRKRARRMLLTHLLRERSEEEA